MKTNFKNFVLSSLIEEINNDIHVNITKPGYKKDLPLDPYFMDLETPEIKKELKTFLADPLTISDHLNIQVQKGSENLYFDLTVYNLENDKEYILNFWTKDQHQELKNLIKEIIKQA